MAISTRILRAEADALATRPRFLTAREIARQENILATATTLLARHGTHEISFRALALALRLSTATLRFHFIDMDDLLGAILAQHLRALSCLLGEVAAEEPGRLHAARRAAWHRATRDATGAHTMAHTLLLRDRFLLPPDLREAIELSYRGLGALLSETATHEALAMLDDPAADLERIEALLTAAPPPVAGSLSTPAAAFTQQPEPEPDLADIDGETWSDIIQRRWPAARLRPYPASVPPGGHSSAPAPRLLPTP